MTLTLTLTVTVTVTVTVTLTYPRDCYRYNIALQPNLSTHLIGIPSHHLDTPSLLQTLSHILSSHPLTTISHHLSHHSPLTTLLPHPLTTPLSPPSTPSYHLSHPPLHPHAASSQVNELMPVATGGKPPTLAGTEDGASGGVGLEGVSATDREELRWQEIYLQNLGDNQESSSSGDNPAFPSPFIQTRL